MAVPAALRVTVVGGDRRPALALATRRPAVAVAPGGLPALAASHPHDLVMVGRMRCVDGAPRIDYGFARAADLAGSPPAVPRCR